MKTSKAATLTVAAMAAEYLERMGARMRSRREELGLSRDEVARRMAGKTNGNAIYRWERGEHRPHDDTLQELADVLGVDPTYFLAPEPEPGVGDLMGALAGPSQLDRIEAKLDELLTRLPAEGLAEVLELAADQRDAPRTQRDATPRRKPQTRKAS